MKRSYGVPSFRVSKKQKYNQAPDVALATSHYVVKQGREDYAMSLIDPWAKIDCRIPDLACFPTATFTVEHNVEWNPITLPGVTNTQLMRVYMHGSAYLMFYEAFAASPSLPPKGVTQLPQLSSNITGGISSLYKSARLVSAGIKVTWAGNDSNTTGTIYGAFVPEDANPLWETYGQAPFDSALGWQTVSEQYMGPMRSGVVLRSKPVDAASFDMTETTNLASGAGSLKPRYGSFYVAVNPSGASGLKFNVNIVLNYEGIVVGNNLGIDTGVSDADPIALAHGMNVAGRSLSAFASTSSAEEQNIRTPARLVRSAGVKSKRLKK